MIVMAGQETRTVIARDAEQSGRHDGVVVHDPFCAFRSAMSHPVAVASCLPLAATITVSL